MVKARVFDLTLFFTALIIVYYTEPVSLEVRPYLLALIIYWFFSSLYFPLKYSNKTGSTTIDYAVSSSLSFVIFAGPLGLLIFESIYGLTVYAYKKWTKTADEGEFLDTLYNIGSFVITNSICFYIYMEWHEPFSSIPFGFWILMMGLGFINTIISTIFLHIVFYILGDFTKWSQLLDFIKNRSLFDLAKISFTNGFLLVFLLEENWTMLVSMFILTYIVSRSFYSKALTIKTKTERDRFEQMAYTDFLTGVSNRAAMDKQMTSLNVLEEQIGLVVADIDYFKNINDNYNHAVGDQVIRHFATTLKGFLGTDDHIFRTGGEEFSMFIRNRSYEDCVQLVKDIITTLDNSSVTVEYKGAPARITYTSSFGLFYYKINQNIPLEKAYIQADQLLIESKQSGRNKLTSVHK